MSVLAKAAKIGYKLGSDKRYKRMGAKGATGQSSMWQFVARKVSFSLTMAIPPNGTGKLLLTQVTFALVSEYLNASINTTKLISSASFLKDIALIDLGDVTRIPTDSRTQIKIDFEVQLLRHVHMINSGVQWVSVGVQYINQSVWAAQLAVKTIQSAVSRPDLMISFWSDSGCMSDAFDKYVYRFLLVFNVIWIEFKVLLVV